MLAERPLPAWRLLTAFLVGATVLAITALLSVAQPASADQTDRTRPLGTQAQPRTQGVSTSPEALAAPSRSDAGLDRSLRVVDDEPPLTRAATRQRLQRMSPTRWLAHYGDVSIERRN